MIFLRTWPPFLRWPARLFGVLPAPLLVLLLAFAGCSGRTATHETSTAPARIISCSPNLTEMLFALGAGDRVIGVTRWCRYPPEAATRPPLGDLYQPNLEAMVAARPDLIVAVPGNTKVLEFFSGRAEPRILETNACETIADIQATLRQLGAAVGAAERAEALVREMNSGLDSLAAAGDNPPPVRTLMILGHAEGALEQIYAVGSPTYLDELLVRVGGTNVVPKDAGRYPIITREAILTMNPELILERHLGGVASAEQKQAMIRLWDELPTLPAVRNGRVVVMDDDHMTINGVDLVNTGRKLARVVSEARKVPEARKDSEVREVPEVRVSAPSGQSQ
ncbi:MAG: helical backbone metal receptor [Candidatus Eisenbacteria bacterium]|nr:helical backbone metal receptor [Candidatus Eisenbacteria bacterium]